MILSFFQTLLIFLGIFFTGFQLEYQNIGSKDNFLQDREEIRWNWDNIRIDAREIAIRIKRHTKEFEWGTATAAHQVEGNNTNNWSEFEKIPGKILNGDKSGEACQHYTRFRNDFDLMSRELNVNAYRFSIEWSRIQPTGERGKFSEKEVRHYHVFIDELIRRGIKPMATLHHFSHPIWFEQMGSFTKAENIVWFTEFSEFVFKEYSSKVDLWCTFNEMSVLMTAGYFGGVHAPGKTDTQLGLTFSGNVLRAHTETYFKLKSLPNGQRAKIGMVHAYHQFDPYNTWNPLQRALCNTMDYIYNDATLEYFKTGKYSINIPFIGNVEYNNPNGPKSQDFIGLNYYSHYHVQLNFDVNRPFILAVKPEYRWLMTDMNYTIYGEGFYRAIKRYGKVGVPVQITENGLADRNDTYLRDLYIKRYLYALSKTAEEGVDVRSYYFWSFMDNFEWAEGFDKRFGLYHTDYKTQRRTLRRGAKFFIDVVKEYRKLSKEN